MKDENKRALIKKEQLLNRQRFIGFCGFDKASTRATVKLDVDERFLLAAEQDGFLRPLLIIDEKVRQQDGSEKIQPISYYSPFQLFVIAALRENSVLDDGLLWGQIVRGELDFYRKQGSRVMNWGVGMGFNVDHAKKRQKDPPMFSPFLVCDYFQQFVELLHGLDLYPRHEVDYRGEGRLFGDLPSYAYNFDPIKANGKNIIKNYGLNLEKINALRWHVGNLAVTIDPLEYWHYYIERHPQTKRDLLKGDAAIAQELYPIYGFLTKIHELVSGQHPEPIMEFINQKHRPFMMPQTHFQTGEDIKALRFAIQQFGPWAAEKKNKLFASKDIKEAINEAEKKLVDFEKRYGDRQYAGSWRYTGSGGKTLDDLDDDTKGEVLRITRQLEADKIPFDLDDEIGRRIMDRLMDLKRETRQILGAVTEQFRRKENDAWERERRMQSLFWIDHRGEMAKLDQRGRMALFKKEHDKVIKEAQGWEDRARDFGEKVGKYTDLIFCKVCRKNPVQLHIENNNRNTIEISRSVICDECIKNNPEPRKMSGGEWKCLFCGRILYKFASNNLLSDLLVNGASANIALKYGTVNIIIVCPYKGCGEENEKNIEWGWMP